MAFVVPLYRYNSIFNSESILFLGNLSSCMSCQETPANQEWFEDRYSNPKVDCWPVSVVVAVPAPKESGQSIRYGVGF